MSTTILVTGALGPAGRALLPQLIARQIPVIGVDMAASHASDAPVQISAVPPAKDPAYLDALRELIAQHAVRAVIPTVSEELVLIAEARETLGTQVVVSSPAAVRIADDKLLTAQRLAAAGVAIPDFAAADELDKTQLSYPIVIKPRISRGARGVRVVRSPEEVGEVDATQLAQTFAPGTEYAPVVYSPRLGTAPFVAVLEKTGLSAGQVGNATGVRRVSGDAVADVAALARRAVEALGLSGPVDLDVRRDESGIARVLEINARFGANSLAAPELVDLLLADLEAG